VSAGKGGARGGVEPVPAPGDERLAGVVADFDEHVGLGTVATPEGFRYGFHCTQIAGGGRSIPAGASVTFVVIPGRGGRWEAGDVRPDAGAARSAGPVGSASVVGSAGVPGLADDPGSPSAPG